MVSGNHPAKSAKRLNRGRWAPPNTNKKFRMPELSIGIRRPIFINLYFQKSKLPCGKVLADKYVHRNPLTTNKGILRLLAK
jgi:hypothetical protein